MNINKTKTFHTGGKIKRTQACKYPCSACRKGVVRNSTKCTKCKNWVHKRCSEVQGSVKKATNFICQRCLGQLDKNVDERITLDGNGIETLGRFFYLRNVLSTKGVVQEAVNSRMRSAWKKLKDVSSILCKKDMSLRINEILYKSYVPSTLSYNAECWAMRREGERKPKVTEMRMLRILCDKILKVKVSNDKNHEMTGVESIIEFKQEQRPQ